MNIKITKEEFEFLYKRKETEHTFGSHLYKTNKPNSDKDILILYESFMESDDYLPNKHTLQYDDMENNIQYLLATNRQFHTNLFSGESTIFSDVLMFMDDRILTEKELLNVVRTYNIIKAYIGFARRDLNSLKEGKNKLFHVERGLYCADCLMNNQLPDINEFKTFGDCDVNELVELHTELRNKCNTMFQKNELTMYPKEPIIEPMNALERKIMEANNIKEFKYV